jgi:hypothetical protein
MRIVTNGQDPLTKPIMDYLTDRYGSSLAADIRRVQLDSTVSDVQRIIVTLLVRDDPTPTAGDVLEQDTVMVPLIKARMRDEQPRSHAPTTCAYLLSDKNGQYPCGELIRWHTDEIEVGPPIGTMPGRGYWVHVSDGRLGTSAHPATPGV